MRRSGDLKFIQELNRSIVLEMIRQHGPISRIDIAKRTGMSPTTVTSAVNELIRTGWVQEDGVGHSSGGRKPILLRFSPDRQFLVGVSITHTSIIIAEMNFKTVILREMRFPIQGQTSDDFVAYVLDSIDRFLQTVSDRQRLLGLSVIVPGIIDAERGVIQYNSKLQLKDIPLKAMIEERCQIKTYLDNDTNAMVLAEKLFGAYSQLNNLIYVIVGDAVGAGIMINGQVFRGFHGGAGEFGHTSIDQGGIPCECGNTGCLENYISWYAVYSRIVSSIAKGRSSEMLKLAGGDFTRITSDIFQKAIERKDQLATEIAEESIGYLSVGIVNLINLFDPEMIILGGPMVEANRLLVPGVQEEVSRRAVLREGVQVRMASISEDIGLKGAAAVMLQEMLHIPLPSSQ